MTRKGIWIDDPPSLVKTAAYWDNFPAHGLTTAGIMLESIGNGFNPMYTVDDLTKVRGLAFSRNVEIVLTIWPEPNKKYLDDLEAQVSQYIVASGCAALEFDAEGNWIPGKVSGFPTLHDATLYLAGIMQRLSVKHNIRIELTTFTQHTENSSRADLATHVHRLLPQAYSVADRNEGPVAWGSQLAPGNMQKLTLDRAKQVQGTHKLCCGLAAYDQQFDGHTAQEAMKLAWDTAVSYGCEEIRFWSSKWVFGVKKNGYSSAFLKSIKG